MSSSISYTENVSRSNNRPPAPPPPPPPPPKVPAAVDNSTSNKSPPSSNSSQKTNVNRPAKPPKPTTIKTKPVEEAISELVQSQQQQAVVTTSSNDPSALSAKSSNPFADDDDIEGGVQVDTELGNVNTSSHASKKSSMTVAVPIPPSSSSRSSINNNSKRTTEYSAVATNSPTTSEKQSDKDTKDGPRPSFVTGEALAAVPKKKHVDMTVRVITCGEPDNPLYHKIRFSESWLVAFLLLHIGQFSMLLVAAKNQLSAVTMAVLVIVVVSVAALVIAARWLVTKSRLSERRNIKLRGGSCTPEDEADIVPDSAVECLAAAAILEGIAYAVYASIVAGNREHLDTAGYYTLNTILQTIRFASITLLALHKIIRPANRIDPMRTIMELEVVAVCWDAIDGSTLFEILDLTYIGTDASNAARTLMAFWYFSVGVRMALMFMTQLSPTSSGYRRILTAPLELAPQPTVDRTLQGLRLRAIVIMAMAFADFYAAGLRLCLWSRGQLSSLQQDMAIKNVMFLMACSGAYDNYQNTITRNWNSREILTWPVHLQYPDRSTQVSICRWVFVVSYLLIGALMSLILIEVSPDKKRWVANIGLDVLLSIIFVIYCKNVHVKADTYIPTNFFNPRKSFVAFPSVFGGILGGIMAFSLLGGRIPGLFYNHSRMYASGGDNFTTYNNALLLVSLSAIPIALYGLFWALAYMVYRKEFTAAPGNYNAIHDPVIQMVSTASMTEGALDVLSCSTLMALASNNLPAEVNGAIVVFCLLEIVNACQSFALQCMLSGGHDDTPRDLVRWNAQFRISRAIIDAGAIVLRVVLWVQYNAVSSVFLVKNLYNLVHTVTQIERWYGVGNYPKDTLFSQFVSPQDWYGLNKEQWRFATSETVLEQARSGRRV